MIAFPPRELQHYIKPHARHKAPFFLREYFTARGRYRSRRQIESAKLLLSWDVPLRRQNIYPLLSERSHFRGTPNFAEVPSASYRGRRQKISPTPKRLWSCVTLSRCFGTWRTWNFRNMRMFVIVFNVESTDKKKVQWTLERKCFWKEAIAFRRWSPWELFILYIRKHFR